MLKAVEEWCQKPKNFDKITDKIVIKITQNQPLGVLKPPEYEFDHEKSLR